MSRKSHGAWVLIMASAVIPGPGSLPLAADPPELVISCRHDPDDRILTLVCDRVEQESAGVAAGAGYRVTVSATQAILPPDAGPENRSLDIRLAGTRPGSQFGTRQIDAVLSGSYGATPGETWESELTAEGAPRDLVHPVADALLARIEAFLATRAGE